MYSLVHVHNKRRFVISPASTAERKSAAYLQKLAEGAGLHNFVQHAAVNSQHVVVATEQV